MPTAFKQVPGFLQEMYKVPGTWNFKVGRSGIRIQGALVITDCLLITTESAAESSDQA